MTIAIIVTGVTVITVMTFIIIVTVLSIYSRDNFDNPDNSYGCDSCDRNMDIIVLGPDNSSKPLCLGCFRKVSGIYKCPRCHWPMCQPSCTASPYHIEECQLFMKRGAKITIPWYDRPCTYYDAILPLRVLLTKYHNPQVYYLINLLMDHNDSLDEATVKRRQTLVDFLRKTCKLANDFSNEEVHKVLGILSVNSFVVHDGGDNEANSDLIGKKIYTVC